MTAPDTVQAYPLHWPLARPRTKAPTTSYFFRQRTRSRHTVGQGIEGLLGELRKMGAEGVVVSSNMRLRKDGLPFFDQAQPRDPGVAVYFTYEKAPVCLACDQWSHVEDNLWAIFLTLEAMRGIDRWGAAKLAATFTGYAALPAPAPTAAWSTVLGVDRFADWERIRETYRFLAKQHHPDTGGDADKFHTLQAAYEQARQERGK